MSAGDTTGQHADAAQRPSQARRGRAPSRWDAGADWSALAVRPFFVVHGTPWCASCGLNVMVLRGEPLRLHCPDCDQEHRDPVVVAVDTLVGGGLMDRPAPPVRRRNEQIGGQMSFPPTDEDDHPPRVAGDDRDIRPAPPPQHTALCFFCRRRAVQVPRWELYRWRFYCSACDNRLSASRRTVRRSTTQKGSA